MRTLPSGINGQITTSGAYAGWLVRITTNAVSPLIYRYTSLDTNFVYSSETYSPLDMEVPAIVWDGSVLRPASLTVYDDASQTLWAASFGLFFLDAAVALYAIYAAASGEVVPVWSGRVSEITRDDWRINFALSNDSEVTSSPRLRVQQIVDDRYLITGGQIFVINGQPWRIDRATTGAG